MFSLAAVLHIKTSSRARKQCLNPQHRSVLGWFILWEKRYHKERVGSSTLCGTSSVGVRRGFPDAASLLMSVGTPLPAPLSLWPRLGGRSCCTPGGCYNQQPTTASLRNSPVGSSPSRSHGYFCFQAVNPARLRCPWQPLNPQGRDVLWV